MGKPRIFISHCQNDNTGPTEYAANLIYLLGCIPVIAEDEPKLAKSVQHMVTDSMNSCDAVLVVATPDNNGGSANVPSPGVLVEIGKMQEIDRFKGRCIVVKEESVSLTPMVNVTYYKFSLSDYSNIARALLIELGSMGLFCNYYGLPGSELALHELIEILSQLRDLRQRGALDHESFIKSVEDNIRKIVEKITQGVS